MSLSEIDIVKMEKEKAMLRYHRFNKISTIATTLEFCFAVVFFSWLISRSSAYFPATVQLLRSILRPICTLVVNHHFAFLIGNLIVVTLLLKSGHSACKIRIDTSETVDDHADDLIRRFLPPHDTFSCEISSPNEDEERISAMSDSAVQKTEQEARRSRRTRSEEFEPEMEKIQLRRSETEPQRKSESSEEESTGKKWMQVEDLSNEEFQRKVEAFIEQQQRFLREESFSMVMRN